MSLLPKPNRVQFRLASAHALAVSDYPLVKDQVDRTPEPASSASSDDSLHLSAPVARRVGRVR